MWSYMAITMSILYRPIKQRVGKLYTVEPYNGTNDDRIELFKHAITMDVVLGAIGFFLDLQKDLQIGILTYSMETLTSLTPTQKRQINQLLIENGLSTQQFQSLLTLD